MSEFIQPAVRRARKGLALAALAVALGACGGTSTIVSTPTATVPPTATAVPPTPTAAGYAVKVFFSRHPDTDSNVNAVFPVNRVSPTLGVGTYAIQQLIAGPTAAEATAGYFTELTASLSGASNCGGADFTYTISGNVGTLKFCKQTQLAGDLTGARIQAEIVATLTQFPNVTKVIILTSGGHCFNDLSGADMCLH
jgi:spore germination protein GerM